MSQFDGSETATRQKNKGPTNGQVILCTLLVFGVSALVIWMFAPPYSVNAQVGNHQTMTPGAMQDEIDAERIAAERLGAEVQFIAPRDAKGSGFGVVKGVVIKEDVLIVTILAAEYDWQADNAFEAVDLKRDLKEGDRCRFFWFDGRRRSIGGMRFAIKKKEGE